MDRPDRGSLVEREGVLTKRLHALPLTTLDQTRLVAQPDDSSRTISECDSSFPVPISHYQANFLVWTQAFVAITI